MLNMYFWGVPAFYNGCALFLSMVFLHVGTYFYVLNMTNVEQAMRTAPSAEQVSGPFGELSPGLREPDVSYGSLEDPIEGTLGFKAVNIHVLDMVSATLPMAWGAGTILTRDLQLWTKLCTCNAFLALFKGILGMATVVPDSSGWANCKERLGASNLEFLRTGIPNPFDDGMMATFSALFKMELSGPHHDRLGSGMRFCADMMYSGHTYFTCLYALGLVELARRQTLKRMGKDSKMRHVIVYSIILFAVVEQVLEIYLVLLSRFHYTMDIIVAVVMTLLFYTNGPIVLFAKRWASGKHEVKNQLLKDGSEFLLPVKDHQMRAEGDLYVPICCIPFCSLRGYHHLVSTEDLIQETGAHNLGEQLFMK